MANDSEFLEQRREADQRAFLIGTLDHEAAPRTAPAFWAGRALLEASREPVPYATLVATMARASDLTIKSIDNRLRQLVAVGFVEQRGEYRRVRRGRQWAADDSRCYELGDWPLPNGVQSSTHTISPNDARR